MSFDTKMPKLRPKSAERGEGFVVLSSSLSLPKKRRGPPLAVAAGGHRRCRATPSPEDAGPSPVTVDAGPPRNLGEVSILTLKPSFGLGEGKGRRREVPPARIAGEDLPSAAAGPSVARRPTVRRQGSEAMAGSRRKLRFCDEEAKEKKEGGSPRDYRRQWMVGSPPTLT